MRKRRRSKRRIAGDLLWTLVVSGLGFGGVIFCARYQGDIHSSGIRLALILVALGLGAGAGLLIDRISSSRRIGHGSANRKTRRQIRTITYVITGMVAASWIIAWYMASQVWLIAGGAAGVLAVTWMWYIIECRLLARGKPPGKLGERKY